MRAIDLFVTFRDALKQAFSLKIDIWRFVEPVRIFIVPVFGAIIAVCV
ncbi:hypothetical protein ALT785_780021 [Alteromonas infernus]